MSDRIFLDSNILVYCYSDSDFGKQKIARALATTSNAYISTQVLNETANVLNKKYGIKWKELEGLITDFENNFFIHTLVAKDIKQACRIAKQYGFSYYDSLIVSSSIECNCTVLYSEDFHHGQVIENDIKIINPFL